MSKKKSPYPKVAIVGAGASGLSCAYFLSKFNVQVDIFEKSNQLGGLATSTQLSKGRIDTFYHHLFETDEFILKFLKDLDIQDKVIFRKTITGHIYENKYYDISGLKNLFTSGLLSKVSYMKLLLGGAIIKFSPNLPILRNKSVIKILDKLFGEEASNKIWKPLIVGKFGKSSNLIPYSWLQARIKDRSINLGFAKNGFEEIYEIMASHIKSNSSNIYLESKIEEIKKEKNKIILNNKIYDKLVVTSSPNTNKKLLTNLNYQQSNISYIGAICGIIEFTKKPIPAYWTGITPSSGKNKPEFNNFLALISYAELDLYWNEKGIPTWPLYIASYLTEEEYKKYSENIWREKMINSIIEISKISMNEKAIARGDILNISIAFAEYAQPILSPSNDLIPNPEKADLTYFANMHNIYPNDRGQNRAFEIGEKRALEIVGDLKLKR